VREIDIALNRGEPTSEAAPFSIFDPKNGDQTQRREERKETQRKISRNDTHRIDDFHFCVETLTFFANFASLR
jgi:hypothetical protein